MFGKVIYYDRNKVLDYTAIIDGKPQVEVTKTRKSKSKEAGLAISAVSAGAKQEETYEETKIESILHNITEFESKLRDRDDFFDFTERTDLCLESICKGNIVKFDGLIYVPENFGMIQMVEKFKPMIMGQATLGMQTDEAEMLGAFFETQNTKIPIISNVDDTEICALIEGHSLEITFEELEDLEDSEMTILARTLDNRLVDKAKPFFDPLKHFIQLPRALRRTTDNRNQGEFSPICADENYRLFEIIAIYG